MPSSAILLSASLIFPYKSINSWIISASSGLYGSRLNSSPDSIFLFISSGLDNLLKPSVYLVSYTPFAVSYPLFKSPSASFNVSTASNCAWSPSVFSKAVCASSTASCKTLNAWSDQSIFTRESKSIP